MNLPKINQFLLAAIVAVCLYIAGLPLYQVASFWWLKHIDGRPDKLAGQLAALPTDTSRSHTEYSQGEHLVVPSIALDQTIHEGSDASVIDRGVWLWPNGADPGQTGNTVLIGQRLSYRGPSVFGHLDLVQLGDDIFIIRAQRKYAYTVIETKVVSRDDISTLQAAADKRLTLYAPASIWNSQQRLIIIAKQAKS